MRHPLAGLLVACALLALTTGGGMANKKISELTAATTPLAGTEVVPIVQDGATRKVAVSELGGGGGTYTLPTASTTTLGGVKIDGSTITIADGVISAAAGTGGGSTSAFAYADITLPVTNPISNPTTGLHFNLEQKTRDLVMLDDRFAVIDDELHFDSTRFTRLGSGGTVAYSAGQTVLTGGAGGTDFRFQSTRLLRAPYAVMELTVAAFSNNATTDIARVGLYKDADDYIELSYDRAAGTVSVNVVIAGVSTTVISSTAVGATGVTRIALRVEGAALSAWVDAGGGWFPIATGTTGSLNLFSVFGEYAPGFGGYQASGQVLKLARFRAGYPGALGYRVPIAVTWKDGSPYIRDNRLYLTLVTAGLPHNTETGEAGHTGIYAMDLDTYAVEEVGKHFYVRNSETAGLQGSMIVVDNENNEMVVLVTTFGSPAQTTLRNAYASVKGDILHGVHVLPVTDIDLPIPAGANGAYDGWLAWDESTNRWYCGTAINVSSGHFYPGLYRSPVGTLAGAWELVASDETVDVYEAAKLFQVGGVRYWVFSGGSTSTPAATYRVYDWNLTYVGNLDAPNSAFANDIPPHAMIVPIPRQGKTEFLMISSENKSLPVGAFESEGNLLVLKAVETETGYEHPYRIPGGGQGGVGEKGDPGGLVFKGAYSDATAYAVDDVVSHGGSAFVALQATTGNTPSSADPPVDTAYWGVLARKGSAGAAGALAAFSTITQAYRISSNTTLGNAVPSTGELEVRFQVTASAAIGGAEQEVNTSAAAGNYQLRARLYQSDASWAYGTLLADGSSPVSATGGGQKFLTAPFSGVVDLEPGYYVLLLTKGASHTATVLPYRYGTTVTLPYALTSSVSVSAFRWRDTGGATAWSTNATTSMNSGLVLGIPTASYVPRSGTTAQRPTGVPTGFQYYDTTLGKPIWYSGSDWKDAAGASV